jgi:hypothetical protein
MDKLTKQLKTDAAHIDVQISDELDRRILASLQGVTPEKPERLPGQRRSPVFWWVSSLTGATAAILLIVIVNVRSHVADAPLETGPMSPVAVATTPTMHWNAESAMLTRPLEQELEDLQSDIKKAEKKVKRDIGL